MTSAAGGADVCFLPPARNKQRPTPPESDKFLLPINLILRSRFNRKVKQKSH